MTQLPAKTIRLQNKTTTNLSLNLQRLRKPASPGLRRSMLLTPINVPASLYFDVCAVLNIPFIEAKGIIEMSPEVKAFVGAGRLEVIEWPPEGHDPAPKPPPKPKVEPKPEPKVEEKEPEPEPEKVALPPPKPEAVVPEEPSMAWTEAKLRDYAEAHDIDVKKAKSKTAVLRAIRKKN